MFGQGTVEFKIAGVQEELIGVQQWLIRAASDGTAAHEVERQLFRTLLALGHKLFGGFLKQVGPGDLGPTTSLEDGRVLTRLPEPQTRRLVTVFGEFEIPVHVYGTRPGQKIELRPTDQRLQLPESEVSYLLQNWDQLLGMEQAFGVVNQTLQTILGLKQPVDTLERGNRQMAEAAPAFRDSQPAPDPKEEGEFLVATEDNKGVPMVRPVDALPAGAHRAKGEKANKKQMACIGCVYTVDPHHRTAKELVATLFRDEDRPRTPPPKARQKRYWASLTRQVAEQTIRAQAEVFQHLGEEIDLRRRDGQTLVHLCDGQHSLETDRNQYLPRDGRTVDILDLMHVLPRLWEAGHLYHAEGSDEASQFVRQRLLRVLEGEAAQVIAGLRRLGTTHQLKGARKARLEKLCEFLHGNLHRMRYDEYLRAGYPIATGVIEGACRHVIKDRMERAGMRWKVPGAQAMLQLRTIYANGDWQAFQEYRVQHETNRLYPHSRLFQERDLPLTN